ncbi:proteasome assembly chaperone 4-like [Condylostylus longicornis]|uniref:proteasome assembly chaperone 4-like n=1 Tax=Condylostylus longicornis TaxID=2530218 RepID=UPI00244E5213|nr:proteasome assembly chaperone 4-like [Condylostylus longicornis]
MSEGTEYKKEPSKFTSQLFTTQVGESTYNFRVLKMVNSIFIYIGTQGNESLDEMGIAMPMKNNEIVGTTIAGPLLGCDSQELASKLAKRLGKQVFISCNIPTDRMIRPAIEKALTEKIKLHPDAF